MLNRRLAIWMTMLLVAAVVMTGCAPRPGAGETAAGAAADMPAVDLPSLAIDVAADGTATVGGIPLAALAGSLGIPGLESLPITADQVAMLTAANVQHIQLNNKQNGMKILVNGQEIPSLGWDKDILQNTAGLVGQVPGLEQLLPLVTNFGFGVTLRFPLKEGATPAPLEVSGADTAAAKYAETQKQFVDSVGAPPTVNIPVQYNADGTWTVAGIESAEWVAITGQDIFRQLNSSEGKIRAAVNGGLKGVDIQSDPNGLHIVINGNALPYIDWSDGKLASAIDIAKQSGLLAGLGVDPETLTMLLDTWLPMVTATNVNLKVSMPELK